MLPPFLTIIKEAIVLHVCFVFLLDACKFPRYLQTNSVWSTNYKDGNILKAYFKGNYIQASRCNPEGTCVEYRLKCLSELNEDKFEVEHIDKDEDSPSQYLCVQFLRRTDSIIQMKESSKLYFRNPNACRDHMLTLDNWPLVSSDNFYKRKVKCPFEGGYNLRMQKSNGDLVCASRLIPARLESECETGDGITIDFRTSDCLEPDLEMDLIQTLYCVATWEHGDYTFIIVRPQEEDFKAWCLRITGTGDLRYIKQGHLFLDFVCDPGDGSGNIRETSNYLLLEFELLVVNTICADQSEVCDENRLCGHEIGFYCPKACNRCSGELRPCSFPEKFRGHWLDISTEQQHDVNITYYDLSIANEGRFQCLEKEGNDFTNISVMFQTFENGCFPRFACLDLTKQSALTLEYRMGNRVKWPVKSLDNLDNLKSIVCDESNFRTNAHEKHIYGKQVEEKPMNILIDPAHHFSEHCELDIWQGFQDGQLYAKEDGVCDMCLVYDVKDHSDKIMQVPLNCSARKHDYKQRDYKCIAKFPIDEDTHAVVTRTLHVHQQYLCWMFIRDKDKFPGKGRVFILDPAHCNVAAVASLKYGILTPKHTYILPDSPKNCPYLGGKVAPIVRTTTPSSRVTTTTMHGVFPVDTGRTQNPYYHDYTSPQSIFDKSRSGTTCVHAKLQLVAFAFLINSLLIIIAL